MQIRNKLAGNNIFAEGMLICKINPIHICNRREFCQYHQTFKHINKNIKKYFKLFLTRCPTDQDLFNDTVEVQIYVAEESSLRQRSQEN